MARRIVDISRRQVLKGAGGFALSLPFMASLAETSALGGDPVYKRRPRLFWFTTDHGAAFETNMFPDPSLLTSKANLFPDHSVASGVLKATVAAGQAVLSPILSAKASTLTDRLVGKMNVLRGLDVPFYIAHNTGLHLGNYARNDGSGADGVAAQQNPRPTIDQLMAWSPSFYPDVSSIKQRAMVVNSTRAVSWNWSDPLNRKGTIQNVRGVDLSRDLFNAIFVPATSTSTSTPAPTRPSIADRVLESYQSLRDGNRRLSALDRQRLNDHLERLSELERKLGAIASASCASVVKPTDEAGSHQMDDPADVATHWRLFTDVVTAAFACGTSRIAVFGVGATDRFVGYQGDWHEEVAHAWTGDDQQKLLSDSYQRFFETVFLDAAAKLDLEEAPGMTYLDNSLLVWSQESCMATHESASIPVVTLGSAAGFFKTGLYADYRKVNDPGSRWDPGGSNVVWLGVLYSQWLATVLQSMGVPPADFELWGHKGYGYPLLAASEYGPPWAKHYGSTSSPYFQKASDVLPFLRA
jgi:hypothetical protein